MLRTLGALAIAMLVAVGLAASPAMARQATHETTFSAPARAAVPVLTAENHKSEEGPG